MAEPDKDQKTEAATPKRKRDAEKKGDVLQSRELGTALVMLAGAGWIALAGPWFIASTQTLLKTGLTLDRRDLVGFDPMVNVIELIGLALPSLTALFGVTLLAAVAAPAAMGSLGFRSSGFAFKASKLDPLKGLGRIFGMQGVVELGKSLLKVVLLGAIGWWVLGAAQGSMMALATADARRSSAEMGQMFVTAVLFLTGGLALIGMVDAPIQFLRRLSRLKMTRHEVKEEMKETEGSPEAKQHARQRRHEILSGSARRAVTEASVVLTNPTHFAVALRYRPGKDAVPMVVARGRGDTALAIRDLAREASVPALEYPQLARAIYFTARAGQPIAQDLYLAVATILAFVFNLDRALAEGISQPDITVPEAKRFDERGRRSS